MKTLSASPPQRPRTHTILPPVIGPRNWNHGESTVLLDEGGVHFMERYKPLAFRKVYIRTDDCEIAIGLLIRDDENVQLRVLTCQGFVRDGFQIAKRQRWTLLAVARHRILEIRTIG